MIQQKRSGGKKTAKSYSEYQQKRRETALKRQDAARQQKVQHVRALAAIQEGGVDAAMADNGAATSTSALTPHPANNSHTNTAAHAAADATLASMAEDTPDHEQQQQQQQLFGLDGVDSSQLGGTEQRSYFAQQLMAPEWMTDIPPDLADSWLVMPRPEGKRCLVISSGGSTVSRTRTGTVLHRFSSRLPAGGPGGSSTNCFCVLDCVYQEHSLPLLPHEQPQSQQQQQQQQQQFQQQASSADVDMAGAGDGSITTTTTSSSSNGNRSGSSSSSSGERGTYYIQDVLVWRGYSLVDCGADFRLFWLASKLAEEGQQQPPQQQQVQQVQGGGGNGAGETMAAAAAAVSWSLDGGAPGPGHAFRFCLLPHWPATPEGLTAAVTAGSNTANNAAAAAAAGGPGAGAGAPVAANGVNCHQQQHMQPPQPSQPLAAATTSNDGIVSSSSTTTQPPPPPPPPLPSNQQQSGCLQSAPFTQDGVYLRHRGGHYVLGSGSSPLALLWKDEGCSRYLLDTDAAGVVPPYQQVVLTYQGPDGGGVATADEPPVVLGRLPADFISRMGHTSLRPGRLLRFSIRDGGLLFNPADGSPAGADLAYEGPANQRRGRADAYSKIVFQWQARQGRVRLGELLAVAAGGAGGAGGGGDGQMIAE